MLAKSTVLMPEYAPMLHVSYAQNYAGIIRQGLERDQATG